MLKERLKDVELKITDLSEYLKISRPTLYKFIEAYDTGNYSVINPQILNLFKYIENNELAGKTKIINYILNNMFEKKELGSEDDNPTYTQIKEILNTSPKSDKRRFIELIAGKSDFDEVIKYLLKIYPLLRKRNLEEWEIKLLKPYDDIRDILDTEESK
jgi:predicted transcriptional regulator